MAARIIPPERLPCAWAGPGGATTRTKGSTVKGDLREGVEECREWKHAQESQGVGQRRL